MSKEGEESEYPAYGVTGPAKEVSWSHELDSIAVSVFVFVFSFTNPIDKSNDNLMPRR